MKQRIKVRTDVELEWICQYCGERNEVLVDLTLPGKQDFTEECRVCCRPNHLIVHNNLEDGVYIDTRPDDE
ncbi:MAG: CPXCG motif-containing cysteine-rich protein [Ignavibacteriaceae bacterium]|nr:CPXCG motif-containing cysteine-rich protein [Ignavibacteriaceae bacterium]